MLCRPAVPSFSELKPETHICIFGLTNTNVYQAIRRKTFEGYYNSVIFLTFKTIYTQYI